MDRSNVIFLVSETIEADEIGVQRTTQTQRKVYCNVTSVSLTEWSEGGRFGLNPEFRMTMFAPDYKGEKYLVFNDRMYSIYRTYVGKNDTIDLYVQRRSDGEKTVGTD